MDMRNISIFFLFLAAFLSQCLLYSQEDSLLREREMLESERREHLTNRKFDEGIRVCLRHLKIQKQIHGEGHDSVAASLAWLASFYEKNREFDLAIEAYKESLSIVEEIHGPRHRNTGRVLNYLGNLYRLRQEYGQAKSTLERSLSIYSESFGPDHIALGSVINNLGLTLSNIGQYENAEQLLGRSLELNEKNKGKRPPESIVTILNNLALVNQSVGKDSKAIGQYQRALTLCLDSLGENHELTARIRSNLAISYRRLKQYDRAAELYELALTTRSKVLGSSHPDTLETKQNLAVLYSAQGNDLRSKDLILDVLEEYKAKPSGSLGFGHAKFHLAGLLEAEGANPEAEELYVECVEIYQQLLGEDHPSTISALNSLAFLYQIRGGNELADSIVRRSLEGQHRHFSRMLSYFTERECINLMNQGDSEQLVGTSLNGTNAAIQQLWFKGAVQEGMNQRRIAEAKLLEIESGQSLLSERESLRHQFQETVFKSGPMSAASRKVQQQLDNLEKKIAILLGAQGKPSIGEVGLDEVKSALLPDEVLIETFRYRHRLNRDDEEARYSSVLIRADREPVFVTHQSAATIEKAIHQYRAAITDYSGVRSLAARAASLREAEEILTSIYLTPLEEHLKLGQTLIFSLDSQFHFLPIQLIRDEDGKTFGSKHKVRFVTSGRDLVKNPTKENSRVALILGNPFFQDKSSMMKLEEYRETTATNLRLNLRNGMGNSIEGIHLTPLPGTALECEVVGEKLEKKGYQLRRLNSREASEGALKKSMVGAEIIHLATHGFFLDEIVLDHKSRLGFPGQKEINSRTIQDPMYRSGLALSGAQTTFELWGNGQVPPPAKDGILMAAEASLIHLRGTKLVVLSACETANGEILDGEGVMGLRRGFLSAGANNTIMTLWSVEDQTTVEVMEAFYDRFLKGVHPSIALAEVQNELYAPFLREFGEVDAIARLAPFICMSIGRVDWKK